MSEPLLLRVRRVIAASLEEGCEALERAGGTNVMREAIREVDRVIDDVRVEQEAATTRRLQAMRQQRMFRGQLAAMDEKARFAIAVERDDLAEAALSRRFDFEQQAERLETARIDAADEADRLEECLVALTTRKTQMEVALAAFEAARREAARGGEWPARPDRDTERRVARAEQAFGRAMGETGSISVISPPDTRTAAKVAEIDTLRKTAAIAQWMAALRSERANVEPSNHGNAEQRD